MSAAHSKWPLPPLPEPRTRGPSGNALFDMFDMEHYARAAQALVVEQDRLERGEAVAWMKGTRVCLSIESDEAMLADGWSPLYSAPPNVRRLMEMVRDETRSVGFTYKVGETEVDWADVDLDAIERAWREGKG